MLNPIVFTERVVRDSLCYDLTTHPVADPNLHAQLRALPSLDHTRQSPLLNGPYVSLSRQSSPRLYPWQHEGTLEESWEECRRHAENLRLIRSIGAPATEPDTSRHAAVRPHTPGSPGVRCDLLGKSTERDLFGNEMTPHGRRRR